MFMDNIYYKIWADAIQTFRKFHPNRTDWKITLFIFITWIHALNCWTILIWLKYFNIYDIPYISINLFPSDMINSFFAFAIEFALPFAILNYFLIFYKKRYEIIIQINKDIKNRTALIYSMVVLITFAFTAHLYAALTSH